MTRLRDSQRMKVYRSEWKAFGTFDESEGDLDGTKETAQAFIDKVTRSAWWQKNATPTFKGDHSNNGGFVRPAVPKKVLLKVNRIKGTHRAWASSTVTNHRGRWYPTITIGYPGMKHRWLLLHELAHHGIDEDLASHGPEFARLYLGLVRRFLGKEAGGALLAEFRKNRVRYRKS